MNKIIYNKITVDDNSMLVTQALIDKQGEIIDYLNSHISWHKNLCKLANNSNLYKEK